MHDGVGRLLADDGSDAGLRTGFVISDRHVLTAWHCLKDLGGTSAAGWLQLSGSGGPVLVPVRYAGHATDLDAAVLEMDPSRLDGERLAEVTRLLGQVALPLGVAVDPYDKVCVEGFPESSRNRAGERFGGGVRDAEGRLGTVRTLKLHVEELAAGLPDQPGGLSGGPVLRQANGTEPVVGVVRAYPKGMMPTVSGGARVAAVGGALIASRIDDIARQLPQVADALVRDAALRPVRPWADGRKIVSLTALLRADAEVADFRGRHDERRRLHAWCADPAPQSAWLVTGPGGQGKTRLARQMCHELDKVGEWVAITARGPAGTTEVRDLCGRAAAAGRSLLVVVDYAAEYGAAALTDLLDMLCPANAPGPALRWRLLLLARNTGDWWEATGTGVKPRLEARGVLVPAAELPLAALKPADTDRRKAAFHALAADLRNSVAAFAAGAGLTVTADPPAPDLADLELGSALLLSVAAITSLLGRTGPAETLIDEILDLERDHHWLWDDADRQILYRPTREAFGDYDPGLPHRVETAVAAATLAGASNHQAGTNLVRATLPDHPGRADPVARWLHDLYPPPDHTTAAYLHPLQPDRLGEELITRTIRRELADGLPTSRTLPYCLLRYTEADQVRRMLTVLIRAGQRHADLAVLLADLLHVVPDTVDLIPVVASLPEYNTHLHAVAVTLTQHALRHHDQAHPHWRKRATKDANHTQAAATGCMLLNNLGIRLSGVGRRQDALTPTQEAVTIYRELAKTNPTAYLPNLAASLTNLGIRLSEVGRRQDALTPTQEAVTIYRELAKTNPAAHLPNLANSLWTVGWVCAAHGVRRAEGLAAVQEAVAILTPLAAQLPAAFLDRLNAMRATMAELLDGLGRTDEAEQVRRQPD